MPRRRFAIVGQQGACRVQRCIETGNSNPFALEEQLNAEGTPKVLLVG
jgi:hypothetical protein